MIRYNVTIKTKHSQPIIISVEYRNNIQFIEKFLTIYKDSNKYIFSASELEYYFIERIAIDE